MIHRSTRELKLARLGSSEHEVTMLFADLAGVLTFSEHRSPAEVIAVLMVVFNALGDHRDHVLRASRAALAMRGRTDRLWTEHPCWPHLGDSQPDYG